MFKFVFWQYQYTCCAFLYINYINWSFNFICIEFSFGIKFL